MSLLLAATVARSLIDAQLGAHANELLGRQLDIKSFVTKTPRATDVLQLVYIYIRSVAHLQVD